ncbi:hypothetical protein, partial [Bifidobacterium simiarum]|uniref:hypothetical protein n=1 Tax=Bifidobacterium simiarum TaxID=2045441 RepID=UPI001A9C40AD
PTGPIRPCRAANEKLTRTHATTQTGIFQTPSNPKKINASIGVSKKGAIGHATTPTTADPATITSINQKKLPVRFPDRTVTGTPSTIQPAFTHVFQAPSPRSSQTAIPQ